MAAKYINLIIIPLAFLITSCFEEDERVTPYPGEVISVYDNIEYYQSYFDFESGEILSSHEADLWELGFECSDSGWHILTNSGANWFIWNSQQTDIDASLNYPENDLWAFDNQSAYPDSTAVGNWLTISGDEKEYTRQVYILGRYFSGIYSDIKRIQFIEVNDLNYKFLFKEEGDIDTVTIQKIDSANFVFYSFENSQQQNMEPDKLIYDLQFGPYYDLATEFDLTIPYLVRGVLLSTGHSLAVLDSVNTYDEIDFEKLGIYDFSSQRDLIGYQWKDVSINTSTGLANYVVKPNFTYIIKTSADNYFKFRFLSFSLEGYSGHPRFEFKELKPVL